VALNNLDCRGWGSQVGVYSVAAGYRVLKAIPFVPPNPDVWKSIWSVKSLPKVDHFSWLLAHNSALTAEVLRKKGWEGPSQCSFCLKEEETSLHLFFECPFAKEVWRLATTPWTPNPSLADIPSLLCYWFHSSPFTSHQKDKLACAWLTLPKFIFWKLWLERNNCLFRGISSPPLQVVTKIKSLLGDFLRFQPWQHLNSPLQPLEEGWIISFNPGLLNSLPPSLDSQQLAVWEIRKEPEDFRDWRKTLNRNSLFFDGALKGNPGEAGGGGVLLDPADNRILKYSWGIGIDTNNNAEALALWQGLHQAKVMGIRDISIFGDSRIIIQALTHHSSPSNIWLQ